MCHKDPQTAGPDLMIGNPVFSGGGVVLAVPITMWAIVDKSLVYDYELCIVNYHKIFCAIVNIFLSISKKARYIKIILIL